jgi:hypothetical protein
VLNAICLVDLAIAGDGLDCPAGSCHPWLTPEQHIYVEFYFILTNSYKELWDISTILEEETMSKIETSSYYPIFSWFLSHEKLGIAL